MEMLRDLLLVKPLISDEISEGGLYIPESARTRNSMAGVVSSGKTARRSPEIRLFISKKQDKK